MPRLDLDLTDEQAADLLAAVTMLKAARDADAACARPGSDFQARTLAKVTAAYDLGQTLQQHIYAPRAAALARSW